MQWSQWKPLKSIFLRLPIHNLHYLLEHFGVLDVYFPLLQILVLVPVGDVREGPRGGLVNASLEVHQPVGEMLLLLRLY